jgi:hypothetical protein
MGWGAQLRRGEIVHTETTSHSSGLRAPPRPPGLPEPDESAECVDPSQRKGSGLRVEHDAALLLAALEEIESRRAALQWLAEADLLRVCLA